MAWTYTINGNVWTDQNFLATNFARNFPLLLQDLVADNYSKYSPVTTNLFDMFTVAQVFNLGTGYPASTWIKVGSYVIAIPLSDSTQWVVCQVTAINLGTGFYTLTPIAQSKTTTLGATTLWRVCLTPILNSITAAPNGANGGTGGANVAAANSAAIQGELGTRNEEFFEDFITSLYCPPPQAPAGILGRSPWQFSVTATSPDSYDPGAQITSGLYNDPNHPGIFGISTTTVGQWAQMAYGRISGTSAGNIIWRNGIGMTLEFSFYVPVLGGNGNDYIFTLGLADVPRAATNALRLIYDSTQVIPFRSEAYTGGVRTQGAAINLAAGAWYRVTFKSVAGGGAQVFINGALVQTFTSGQTPTNAVAQRLSIEAHTEKVSGIAKRQLLLDYVYFRNLATR